MFHLRKGTLEFYLERFRVIAEQFGEVSERDVESIRIDFDRVWTTLHSADELELGLLLARLALNHPVNAVWAEDDLQTLKSFLEDRLHTPRWLDQVLEQPNRLLANYVHSVLLNQLCGEVEVTKMQLTPQHIEGQLRVLMETPPDNMTKTLEAIETLHRSRVWLETMTSVKMMIYKTTPDQVAIAIEQCEIAQSIAGQHLERELAPSDQELAAILEMDEIKAKWMPVTQPRTVPEKRGYDNNKVQQDLRVLVDEYSAKRQAQMTAPHPNTVAHRPDCNCAICTSPKLHPSQWIPHAKLVTACGCCICNVLRTSPPMQDVVGRLQSWGFPAHITESDWREVRQRLFAEGSCDYRTRKWDQLFAQSNVTIDVFTLFNINPRTEWNEIAKHIFAGLKTRQRTHIDTAMVIALVWAAIDRPEDRAALATGLDSVLGNYCSYFETRRKLEDVS